MTPHQGDEYGQSVDAERHERLTQRSAVPVTDDDVRAAHEAFYRRADEFNHIPVVPPLDDPMGQEWLAGLRRVLENDRARTAALSPQLNEIPTTEEEDDDA